MDPVSPVMRPSVVSITPLMLIALLLGFPAYVQAQSSDPLACTPDLQFGDECIDERGRLCTMDFLGPACLVDGGGVQYPQCGGSVDIGKFCRNDEGNLCRVTGENTFSCLITGGDFACTEGLGPNAIVVQPCIDGSGTLKAPLLKSLTEQAVADVLEAHQLPDAEADTVMRYARNPVRAHLFAGLSNLILQVDYTAEEAKVVDFFAEQFRELRIRQAEVAEFEFYTWWSNPCGYQPPEGFEVTWETTNCATPFGSLFGLPGHPTLDEFEAYGVTAITREDLLDDPEALGISVAVTNAIVLGASIVGAGLVAIAVGFALFMTSVGPLLVSVTAPFALVPFASGAVVGLLGGVVGIAGAVGIALFAIIGSVIAIITYVDYQEFEDEVTTLVQGAEQMPNLKAEIQTERGAADFFQVFVKSTQPEWDFGGHKPEPVATQPLFFQLSDEAGQPLGVVPSIELSVEALDNPSLLESEVGLSGGWFAPTYTYLDENGATQHESTYTLSIEFVDWEGQSARAARSGTTFVIPQTGSDGEVLEPIVSDVLRFIDRNGNKLAGRLVSDTTPPVITPHISGTTLNGSGWYVSDVTIEWTVEDAESDITSKAGCEPAVVSHDGTAHFMCTASSAGGQAGETATVKRDAAPPSITALMEPSAKEFGWNNTDVVVSFLCDDSTSGVAECPPDRSFDEEGAGHIVGGKAIDVAGNTASIEPFEISIDKTEPEVSISVPADGAAYVLKESVDVVWTASDALSGIAVATGTADPAALLATGVEGQYVFSVEAEDRAGNSITVQHTYAVLSPAQAAMRLAETIVADDLNRGTKTALLATLNKVADDFDAGRDATAIRVLRAFVNQVRALADKRIDTAIAEKYLAEAQKLFDAVER